EWDTEKVTAPPRSRWRSGAGPARVLAGDGRLTLPSGRRDQRTVAATHALHWVCPVGERGSTAATRKYTLDPDGPAPPGVYLVFVQAMFAEYVDASVALVACCTRNPCRAVPRSHLTMASPTCFPGDPVSPSTTGSALPVVRVITSRLNPFTSSA